MTQMFLPTVINQMPTRADIRKLEGVKFVSIAVKVARNIHIRCRLAEAQNWRCCWCGEHCQPNPGHKNSATIEHVQPRSLGGADEWDNYAMACADCNHRRGTISVEDMMAGRFPVKAQNKSTKSERRKKFYINRAMKMNRYGWCTGDGRKLCSNTWLKSLRVNTEQLAEIRAVVESGVTE